MGSRRGFIQFLPMIFLAVIAITTLVIVGMMGNTQDIRGRATDQSPYPTCDNCILGTTKACTLNGSAGIQTCVSDEACVNLVHVGNWGGCVVTSTPTPTLPPVTPTCNSSNNYCATPPVTPIPTCTPNGSVPTTMSCCSGYVLGDLCEPKSTITPTAPPVTPTCNSSNNYCATPPVTPIPTCTPNGITPGTMGCCSNYVISGLCEPSITIAPTAPPITPVCNSSNNYCATPPVTPVPTIACAPNGSVPTANGCCSGNVVSGLCASKTTETCSAGIIPAGTCVDGKTIRYATQDTSCNITYSCPLSLIAPSTAVVTPTPVPVVPSALSCVAKCQLSLLSGPTVYASCLQQCVNPTITPTPTVSLCTQTLPAFQSLIDACSSVATCTASNGKWTCPTAIPSPIISIPPVKPTVTPDSCTPTENAACLAKGAVSCKTNVNGVSYCLDIQGRVYYSMSGSTGSLTCTNGTQTTLASAGSGETTAAMLLSTYVNSNWTPATVAKTYYADPAYCAGSGVTAMNTVLTANGFQMVKGLTTSQLDAYIAAGVPAYAELSISQPNGKAPVIQNTVIVGKTSDGQYIYNDSYYGSGTTLSGVSSTMIGYEVLIPPAL